MSTDLRENQKSLEEKDRNEPDSSRITLTVSFVQPLEYPTYVSGC